MPLPVKTQNSCLCLFSLCFDFYWEKSQLDFFHHLWVMEAVWEYGAAPYCWAEWRPGWRAASSPYPFYLKRFWILWKQKHRHIIVTKTHLWSCTSSGSSECLSLSQITLITAQYGRTIPQWPDSNKISKYVKMMSPKQNSSLFSSYTLQLRLANPPKEFDK